MLDPPDPRRHPAEPRGQAAFEFVETEGGMPGETGLLEEVLAPAERHDIQKGRQRPAVCRATPPVHEQCLVPVQHGCGHLCVDDDPVRGLSRCVVGERTATVDHGIAGQD